MNRTLRYLLLLALALAVMPRAHAQGLVKFNNRVIGAVVAPVYGTNPVAPTMALCGNATTNGGTQNYSGYPLVYGTIYTAQLWGGPLGSSDAALTLAATTTFLTNATSRGFIVAPTSAVAIASVPAGSTATVQLRVWDNKGGTVSNWAGALADPTVARGACASFTVGPLGTNTASAPNLTNLVSLNLHRPDTTPSVTLISSNTNWKYLDNGSDQGTAWRNPAFDDGSWSNGPALFGVDTPGIYPWAFSTPMPVGTNRINYYFRTHFTWSGSTAGAVLTASNYIDDGAVFYLNGTEAGRVRLTNNPVLFNSLANNQGAEGSLDVLTLATSNLVSGDNVLAVEVHQTSPNSSDIVFGMTLKAAVPGPTVTVTALPGWNLIANPLNGTNNALNTILPGMPYESQVMKYVNGNFNVDITDGIEWLDPNSGIPSTTTVSPGEGFFFFNPGAAFNITFRGEPALPSLPAPVVRGGYALLSRRDLGPGTFANIVGLPPEEGCQFLSFNAATQNYSTNIFSGGSWSLGAPALATAQSAFICYPPLTPPALICAPDKTVVCDSGTGTNGFEYTVLRSFATNIVDGVSPRGALMEGTEGAIYGTTFDASDGVSGTTGALYKMNKDGTGYALLHKFSAGGTGGRAPYGRLVEGTDGRLYGTTSAGGSNGVGTIYMMQKSGSNFTVLHAFLTNGIDGETPHAGLMEGADGALYGTTSAGGIADRGTVFKINPNGSNYLILAAFTNANGDGREPWCALMEGADGALYGTTALGGTNNSGTVFKLNKDGSGYAVLQRFAGTGTTGQSPYAGLIEGGDGAIYGNTRLGGNADHGTVFKLNKDGSGFSTLLRFATTNSDGFHPYGALMEGADGAIYGTAFDGGSNSLGTVYRMKKNGTGYEVLKHFNTGTDGRRPYDGLMEGADGAIYGTTQSGGASSAGTIFRLQTSCPWNFDAPTVSGGCCTNVTVTVASTVTNGPCRQYITRTWQATDCCSNVVFCSQTVTLLNSSVLVVDCSGAISVQTCSNSAPVTFTVTATNACCPGKAPVVCFPPSGSLFPLGTNLVSCLAGDTCGNTNACSFTVTVSLQTSGCCEPPTFTVQPASVAAAPGGNAAFVPTVAGTAPLSYQWQFNGMNLAGATGPSLTVPSVQAAQVGDYTLIASGPCGVVTSAVAQIFVSIDYVPDATLAVEVPPATLVNSIATFTLTVVNEGATVLVGQTLTGVFSGAPATFVSATPGCVVTPSGGGFTLTCPLPPLLVNTQVVFTVSFIVNTPGTLSFSGAVSATTAEINLANNTAGTATAFGAAPVITMSPVGFSAAPGDPGSLTVTATGSGPLDYSWFQDGAQLADAAGPTLNFTEIHSSDAGDFVVMVSNLWGVAVSTPATVTLVYPPSLTAILTTGTDGNQTLSVQGPANAIDLEVRLKAGDPTRIQIDDLGSVPNPDFEYPVPCCNGAGRVVVQVGGGDNRLTFNDVNGMVAALDLHFEIHGSGGNNTVVASTTGLDLNALPGFLNTLAATPDFLPLATNLYTRGYTNVFVPGIELSSQLYTNMTLMARALRQIAETNLIAGASNLAGRATALSEAATAYSTLAASRFPTGFSCAEFTNCLFMLIAQAEALEDFLPDGADPMDVDPAPGSVEDQLEQLDDEAEFLAEAHEAGAQLYEEGMEAAGDDYEASVTAGVEAPGEQLGEVDGPVFEALANQFAAMASQLLENEAVLAETRADALSFQAGQYEAEVNNLVLQFEAVNQTIEAFTAQADPLSFSPAGIPTGTSAGCDKNIKTNNKFVISIGGVIIGTPFKDLITAKKKTWLILGLGSDDLIYGNDKFNIIAAGKGDDEVHAQGGVDLVLGGGGNDCLFGDADFDVVFGDSDNDILHGGDDFDLVIGWTGNDKLFGDEKADLLVGWDGDDTLDGGDGIDIILGNQDNDTLTGGPGYKLTSNLMYLCKWHLGNLMIGGNGDDVENGGDGIDVMFGGRGKDKMYGNKNIDVMFGEEGEDEIYTGDGGPLFYFVVYGVKFGVRVGNLAFGGSENDKIDGGKDTDVLFGGTGNDIVRGSYSYPFWKYPTIGFECGDVDIGQDDDLIFGGEGNDMLDGGYDKDIIFGGSGIDHIKGNGEPFKLLLTSEIGLLFGGADDDTIEGGAWDVFTLAFGNDGQDNIKGSKWGIMNLLFGNASADIVDGNGDLINLLFGGDDNDRVEGGSLVLDLMFGGPGDDDMDGRLGLVDVMFGNGGNDTMDGGGGNIELMFGNAGNDTMQSGFCLHYFMFGNRGCDMMLGNAFLGVMFGGDDQDVMDGGFGIDIMFGNKGPDFLNGHGGPDILLGNADNDTLDGEAFPDLVFGGPGDDIIHGGTGPDLLFGGVGVDRIYGDQDPDLIFGGVGNDKLHGGEGPDVIFGGFGVDVIHGDNSSDLLFGGPDGDYLYGDGDGNLIFGGRGDAADIIRGGTWKDVIFGQKGDDIIDGGGSGGGTDRIMGNRGNDGILNRADNSRLRGGRGDDRFYNASGSSVRIFGGPGSDTYQIVGGSLKKARSASSGTVTGVIPDPSCAEIHGLKWNDLNGNSVRDPGEPGLVGVRIYFDLNNNGVWDANEPFTFTMADDTGTKADETGMYWFIGLSAGTYRVREVLAPCWVQTYPSPGANPIGAHLVIVGPEDVVVGRDFGNRQEPPGITCRSNITVYTTGTTATVTYPAPTVSNGSLAGCVPSSGSVFQLGTTPVTCNATNACGTNTCSFNVMVQRVFRPVIVVPPLSQSVVSNGSVTLSVGVANTATTPLGYLWRRGTVTVDSQLSGEFMSFFTITNLQTNVSIRAVVTNAGTVGTLGASAVAVITVLPDSDGDGLPDVWETQYGLNPTNAADRNLDADGDGMTNAQEYTAGTDPNNAASFLKIEQPFIGSAYTWQIGAVSNRTYTVQSSDALNIGPWTKQWDIPAHPTNRVVTVIDPAPSPTSRFYRVATPRQP